MNHLFLVRYPEEPIRVPDKGEVTIGRAEGNDIVLSESRVSRNHAVIVWLEPQQVFVITDLGSSNGTYLNGTRLPANHPGLLNDWDKIRIASAVVTVRVVDDPSHIMNEFKELRSRAQYEVTEVIHLKELKSMLQRPGFSGDLSHLCPVELFQMCETGAKTGICTFSTEFGDGVFSFRDGQIVAATFGPMSGEEAVYEILKWNQGTFSFTPQDVDIANPAMNQSTTSLLMEGCRLMDEAVASESW